MNKNTICVEIEAAVIATVLCIGGAALFTATAIKLGAKELAKKADELLFAAEPSNPTLDEVFGQKAELFLIEVPERDREEGFWVDPMIDESFRGL